MTIYNLTSFTLKVYNIVTKPSTAPGTYCYGYSFAIGPGQIITFENSSTVKFPFYSPFTAPSMPNNLTWTRVTAAESTASNISPLTLYNSPISNTQEFNYISFGIVGPTGGLGADIGISTPNPITNAGLEANYARFGTDTKYEDVITFSEL